MRELVALTRDGSAGAELIDPKSLYVKPSEAQVKLMARPMPPAEEVKAVVKNRPFARLSRTEQIVPDEEVARNVTIELLARCFPSFQALGPEFHLEMTDKEIGKLVDTAAKGYELHGMTRQLEATRREASNFIGARASLSLIREEGLFRSGTFVPIDMLPDLFMATPVWYFVKKPQGNSDTEVRRVTDKVPQTLRYFCDLLPNNRWADFFLLFNYRCRHVGAYEGEFIPPAILQLAHRAAKTFDYVVIATPHLHVAAKDWATMPWKPMPDPYVLGFQGGLPFAFVLARFSGSGIFPLHSEMVADTIHFLRQAPELLKKKHDVRVAWHYPAARDFGDDTKYGQYLVDTVRRGLAAFDEGRLFDWLLGNGEEPKLTPA